MWRDNTFQAGKSEYLWSSGELHKIKKSIVLGTALLSTDLLF